jgi:predicted RNA-binding Zn ribbon-like protein
MPKTAELSDTPHDHLSAHEVVAQRGALALALINTETLDRGKQHDALSSPAALARWWEGTCVQYLDQLLMSGMGAPTVWTSNLLVEIKALRSTMRALITQIVEQQSVQEEDLRAVNEILALSYLALESTEQGIVKAVLHVRNSDQGSVLAPIAHSALHLFTEADWRRLHQCKHDRCIVFFYDSAKSGTRRWCSPECMNRARSIHHYQLTKKAGGVENQQ